MPEARSKPPKSFLRRAGELAADHVDGCLNLPVVDNGVGGADLKRGTGLTGLADRVAAGEGQLRIKSLRGSGTLIRAELPCGSR